ncbi:MAG: creatininase family protein [Gemmatimonadaceae bacterium]
MSGFPFLEHMTSPEAGEAIAAGNTRVLFACGAVEQHGPHLPMFMDAEHGTLLAGLVAQMLGRTLVAPTVRVGCSEHHMAFPGTISIRDSTLEAICTDYCQSLARHGFTNIGIIPSHGGNFGPIREMLPRLQAAIPSSCRVSAYTDVVAMIEMWRAAVADMGADASRVGGHADIAESSIMLTIHPEYVHLDRAEAGFPATNTAEILSRIIRDGLQSVTPNGILGDARGLSASIGARCVEVAAESLTAFFRGAMV